MAESYPHPKMNFRKWVANFWYYYRWPFLFALVALSFVLIASVQFFLQKTPDVSFLYVGPVTVGDRQCKAMISSAESRFSEDYNGNGRREADIRTIQLSDELDLLSEKQKIEANKAFQRYSQEILAGDDCFLLLSPYFYEELKEAGALMSLYEIYGEWPEGAETYNGLLLKNTALGKLDGFSSLPADTVICLKYAGGVGSDLSDEARAEKDALNARIFADLCGD